MSYAETGFTIDATIYFLCLETVSVVFLQVLTSLKYDMLASNGVTELFLY